VANQLGGTEENVKARIAKARTAFCLSKQIWKSREITSRSRTKIRIFNTNVKLILLYRSETWESD
jgi:hypothetical protein